MDVDVRTVARTRMIPQPLRGNLIRKVRFPACAFLLLIEDEYGHDEERSGNCGYCGIMSTNNIACSECQEKKNQFDEVYCDLANKQRAQDNHPRTVRETD